MLIGGNSPTPGFTERGRAAAEVLGPGVMRWLPSAEPGNAVRYPGCLHIWRGPNWTPGEDPAAYAARIDADATRWRSAIPGVVLQLGNEPDLEAGHRGEKFPRYAAAVRSRFPGALVANPPLSVEATGDLSADVCAAADYVSVHSYWETFAPGDIASEAFGASYRIALRLAGARPVVVTEVNAVPDRERSVDWSRRNRQVGEWLAQAERDGVHAACLFILDGNADPLWPKRDVGPEAAAETIARYRALVAPPAPPPPPGPPQPRPEPPPSPAPEGAMYTRDDAPVGTGKAFATVAWRDHLAQGNPEEADAIVAAYAEDTEVAIPGYDANLAIAQGCVETAGFTSSRWRLAHNAAGIGIYSDGTPDVQFGSLRRGIRAQLELLADYYGDGRDPWGVLRGFGFGFDRPLGKVRLSDMDGVWAADPHYSAAIAETANLVVGQGGGVIVTPTWVTGEQVVAAALQDLGHDTFIDEGAVVPSYYRCEEAVEVWEERCGLSRLRYPDANADADAGPLNGGHAPIGARVFFRGPGWSEYGHVGTAMGGGRTISALKVVTISDGWQEPGTGYIGWRYAPGVGPGGPAPVVEDRDMRIETSFDDAELKRLWDGPKTAAQKRKAPFNRDFGIPAAWASELRAGRPLGFAVSGEESDAASGRVVQYFSNGKVTFFPATGEVKVN